MEGTFPRSTGAAVRLSDIRILIAGVAIPLALGTALLVVPTLAGAGSVTTPANTSYDQVEQTRVLFGVSTSQDSSYDQVERARLQVVLPAAPADHSYDDVERNRIQVVLPATPADHSYDDVERLRSMAGV
jgi:hypothetical protein